MQIYTHTQSPAATTWTINHNLGCKPTFDVLVAGGTKVYPASVIHLSDTELQLTFSSPRSGTARLIGSPL